MFTFTFTILFPIVLIDSLLYESVSIQSRNYRMCAEKLTCSQLKFIRVFLGGRQTNHQIAEHIVIYAGENIAKLARFSQQICLQISCQTAMV